jgi:hypothetical protein
MSDLMALLHQNGGFRSKRGEVDTIEFDSIMGLRAFNRDEKDNRDWAYGSYEGFTTLEQMRDAMGAGVCPPPILQQYLTIKENLVPELDKLAAMLPSAGRKIKHGADGDDIDIDALMTGSSDFWTRTVQDQDRLTVRIAINFAYTGGCNSEDIARGAARGVALAEVLTNLGHNVQLDLLSYAYSQVERRSVAVIARIKDSDQPMDVQNFLLCGLPALSRIFKFGVYNIFGDDWVSKASPAPKTLSPQDADLFGVDIMAAGDSYNYVGDDPSGIVRQVADQVGSMILNSQDADLNDRIDRLLAEIDADTPEAS